MRDCVNDLLSNVPPSLTFRTVQCAFSLLAASSIVSYRARGSKYFEGIFHPEIKYENEALYNKIARKINLITNSCIEKCINMNIIMSRT